MGKEISAKDKAFEKERIAHRREVRALEGKIKDLMLEKSDLKVQLSESQSKVLQLEEWVSRLLELVDLTEEKLKAMIKRSEDLGEISSALAIIMKGLRGCGLWKRIERKCLQNG